MQAIKEASLIQTMTSINCHDAPEPENKNVVLTLSRALSNDSCNKNNLQDRGVKVEEELKECYGELLKLRSQPSGGSYSESSIIDDIQS